MVKERQCNGSLNSYEKGMLKPLVLKPLKGVGPKNLIAMLLSKKKLQCCAAERWALSRKPLICWELGLAGSK